MASISIGDDGYKVWLDKAGLLGGERFWPTIQQAIQSSFKVLFVYSSNIVTGEGILKGGIENEIEYAKSIAAANDLKDFIIPLRIDDSPFNLAIGLPNLNQIPFENNWAAGLKTLIKKLEKDNAPKEFSPSESVMSEWYENEYVSNCTIVDSAELFYTSWWTVAEMPKMFYMYQFTNLEQANSIRSMNRDVNLSKRINILSSFEENINLTLIKDEEAMK